MLAGCSVAKLCPTQLGVLWFMGWQRVGRNLATAQQPHSPGSSSLLLAVVFSWVCCRKGASSGAHVYKSAGYESREAVVFYKVYVCSALGDNC